MSTFQAFILLVLAFWGTVMLFLNPLQIGFGWLNGKSQKDLVDDDGAPREDISSAKVLGGCGVLAVFVVLSMMYQFIFQPFTVILALTNSIGNQQLGYFMLGIVTFSWIKYIVAFASIKKQSALKASSDGAPVEAELISPVSDKPFVLKQSGAQFLKRVFYSLPTLYMWYLFLVVIKVFPGMER